MSPAPLTLIVDAAFTLYACLCALAEGSSIVTASANGWDARTDYHGCTPSGCVASNAVDASIEENSRWSRKAIESGVDNYELTLELNEPQDIAEMRIALWKGDRRTRAINVFVDGAFVSTIESSGMTEGYEPYELMATGATTVMLQAVGTEDNGWLSITGVLFMVDSDLEVSPPTPAPASDEYVGCFNDMISDRVMASVMVDDALTPQACALVCEARNDDFYALQQGNECWCASCHLTNFDTNTDYDRHGDGSCNAPCAGDPSSMCGGDSAFSLFQTEICSEYLVGSGINPNLARQILADAVGGFAGPGSYYHTNEGGYSSSSNGIIVLTEEPGGTAEISGVFNHYGDTGYIELPSSIALFLYIDDEDVGDDFARGQGEIDASTGEFIATISDVPGGFSRIVLSFVVLDRSETLPDQSPSFFFTDVVNNECASPLTIALTWRTDNTDLDLFVTEPGGKTVSYYRMRGDVGYLDNNNTRGVGPEKYIVYSGLNTGTSGVVGDYKVQAHLSYTSESRDTAWTLTARINGVVQWVEEGEFVALSYSSYEEQMSDVFTATLDSADVLDC